MPVLRSRFLPQQRLPGLSEQLLELLFSCSLQGMRGWLLLELGHLRGLSPFLHILLGRGCLELSGLRDGILPGRQHLYGLHGWLPLLLQRGLLPALPARLRPIE